MNAILAARRAGAHVEGFEVVGPGVSLFEQLKGHAECVVEGEKKCWTVRYNEALRILMDLELASPIEL